MIARRANPALLIVDMINPLDSPGGAGLQRQAIPVARNIARLKRAHERNAAALKMIGTTMTLPTTSSRRL